MTAAPTTALSSTATAPTAAEGVVPWRERFIKGVLRPPPARRTPRRCWPGGCAERTRSGLQSPIGGDTWARDVQPDADPTGVEGYVRSDGPGDVAAQCARPVVGRAGATRRRLDRPGVSYAAGWGWVEAMVLTAPPWCRMGSMRRAARAVRRRDQPGAGGSPPSRAIRKIESEQVRKPLPLIDGEADTHVRAWHSRLVYRSSTIRMNRSGASSGSPRRRSPRSVGSRAGEDVSRTRTGSTMVCLDFTRTPDSFVSVRCAAQRGSRYINRGKVGRIHRKALVFIRPFGSSFCHARAIVLLSARIMVNTWYPSFEYAKSNFPPDLFGFTQRNVWSSARSASTS